MLENSQDLAKPGWLVTLEGVYTWINLLEKREVAWGKLVLGQLSYLLY
jgi:uncharacterized membrane protein HdeD (DUF308 family)